jgi:hypothetical protein
MTKPKAAPQDSTANQFWCEKCGGMWGEHSTERHDLLAGLGYPMPDSPASAVPTPEFVPVTGFKIPDESLIVGRTVTVVFKSDYDELELRLREAERKLAQLRNELLAAAQAMHNDFEPDNQSKAYHRAIAAAMKEGK